MEEINAEATRQKLEKWEKERAELLARRELFEREKLPGRFEKWLLDPSEQKTEDPSRSGPFSVMPNQNHLMARTSSR